MSATTKRYLVIEGSQSAHCCFEATVVDTTKPDNCCVGVFEEVCECFSIEAANKVADSLNKTNNLNLIEGA